MLDNLCATNIPFLTYMYSQWQPETKQPLNAQSIWILHENYSQRSDAMGIRRALPILVTSTVFGTTLSCRLYTVRLSRMCSDLSKSTLKNLMVSADVGKDEDTIVVIMKTNWERSGGYVHYWKGCWKIMSGVMAVGGQEMKTITKIAGISDAISARETASYTMVHLDDTPPSPRSKTTQALTTTTMSHLRMFVAPLVHEGVDPEHHHLSSVADDPLSTVM